jgi:hypothetical protein
MRKQIEFIQPWRGRVPGQIDAALDDGVKVELVKRRIAKWAEPPPKRVKRARREQ